MNDDSLLLRDTSVPAGQAPPCDENCRRWGNIPHVHIKTEGLDDDTPYLTIRCFCSCGLECASPHSYDARKGTPGGVLALGEVHVEAFIQHLQDVHRIDYHSDSYREALSRQP